MPAKHTFILAMLVLAPLAAFIAVGARLVQMDQERTQSQFRRLLQVSLREFDTSIQSYFNQLEQQLMLDELDPDAPDQLRAFVRRQAICEQLMVLAADGTLLFPDPECDLSAAEHSYLQKVERLVNDRNLVRHGDANQRQPQQTFFQQASNQQTLPQQTLPQTFPQALGQASDRQQLTSQAESRTQVGGPRSNFGNFVINQGPLGQQRSAAPPTHGWYPWYWGAGLQLIHWRQLPDGRVIAVGLLRARWMADVIALLPESAGESDDRASSAKIQLVNSQADPIYLWGSNLDVAATRAPVTSIHLAAPLNAWQLQHFGPVHGLVPARTGALASLLVGGGALACGLMALAWYLSREVGRQTREARQRVSFVSQVSHELKTPLTNIRMYAELLENDLQQFNSDADVFDSEGFDQNKDQSRKQAVDPPQSDGPLCSSIKRVHVITGESARLSRLINNVLTFTRLEQTTQPLRRSATSVDEVVAEVLEQFRPSLDKLQIAVRLDLDADQRVRLDVDALEQILGNLISNVEKYASDGRHLRIRTMLVGNASGERPQGETQQTAEAIIEVHDAGPGIPAGFVRQIFEPFQRASDQIEAAAGTGIGLTIARGLARQQGGDLTVLESTLGAAFRLRLPLESDQRQGGQS